MEIFIDIVFALKHYNNNNNNNFISVLLQE